MIYVTNFALPLFFLIGKRESKFNHNKGKCVTFNGDWYTKKKNKNNEIKYLNQSLC